MAAFLFVLATPFAGATDRAWTPTGNASNDFATGANWGGTAPGGGDRAFIINNSASANQTNIAYRNGDYSMFGAADVGIIVSNSNTAGSGLNKFLLNSGHFQMQGLVIGNNGIVEIGNGASLSAYSQFSLTSGGTLLVNNSRFRMNGEAVADISFSGNIVMNGGTIESNPFGNRNNGILIQSGGRLIANAGSAVTNWVDTGTATSQNGLTIASGGTLQVNGGTTFALNRGANAWGTLDSNNPQINGTLNLNGGSITVYYAGSQATDRGFDNSGTILGSGTLAMRVRGTSGSAQVIASNGVLNTFQTIAGNQQTFTATASANFGTFKAVSGGTFRIDGNVASGMGGSWVVDSGGTLEIAGSRAVDLGTAFMQGANFNGTVKVNAGGNLTFSSAAAGAALLNQSGTFEFVATNNGPASMNMPGVSGLNTFTNNGVFLLSGTGTGSGSWNGGVAGNSYAFVNAGKIDLKSGGTLVINTIDATTTGFSNTTAGSIFITNGATLRIARSATGWGGDTAVNMGTMVLSNGTFQTATGTSGDQGKLFKNAGTILVQGALNTATNYWLATLQNAGTIIITNNNAALQLGNSTTVNWFTNTATGRIILGTNGTVASIIATNGANGTQFSNLGTIQGQGTLTLGQNSATGGQNANYQNSGMLIVTNWGGAAAGTLFISTGNAFSNGGFSNTSVGTILIASNTTLTVNRSQNAWAGSGTSVANLGTISLAGGSLNLASDGIVSNAASFINSGTISGWGTIDSVVITTNGGKVFANTTNLTGVGTLTLRVASTTNNSTATLGTIGTNAVLNLLAPGGQNTLINFGTISVSGGTINFGGGAGTITNFFVVAGVGNLSSFDIVNTGALASIIAQNPIPGLSNLVASVGVTNSAILGANNSGGSATLTLDTATGGGLVNNGTVLIQGGFVTVTNSAGADAGITNLTGLIVGFGTNLARVANLSGGTVMASNGVFLLGAENNLNLGTFTNFNSSSTIRLTNSILVNAGKVFLNGGGLVLSGSTVTNTGTITGPGDVSSALYNDTTGFVAATNGVLNIATNVGEFVINRGAFDISSGSTLSNGPSAWNNSNGTVRINAGTLTGGAVTNKGVVSGNGTIMSTVFNAAEGTVRATNGVLVLRQSAITQNGTLIGGTAAGTYIQATNLAGFFNNNGTMLLDGSGNLAYYILADFSNATVGVISGAGILRTGDDIQGGNNFTIRNMGNILATNGTLIADSGDAFGFGFNNGAGATVTVANASTFGILRTTNAWVNATTNPVNNGAIILNGGIVQTYTNSGTGPTATPVADSRRVISNSVTGVISGNGSLNLNLINLGTVNATNGTLFLSGTAAFANAGTIAIQNGATFTTLQNTGTFLNNGTLLLAGGTFVGTNFTQLRNSGGVISGFGTINTGRTSGTGGANQEIINTASSLILATNGTLMLNPGDAFNIGGFSNSASSTIRVASGAAFAVNRTASAWDNSGINPHNLGTISLEGGSWSNYADGAASAGRFLDNFGTISGQGTFSGSVTNFGTIAPTNGLLTVDGTGRFRQAGTLQINTSGTLRLTNSAGTAALSFTNGGSIFMRGGELQAGVIANTNVIFGFGTISGEGVDNSGALYASNGTLVAGLSSFTNATTATLGTLSTNATLDVTIPGGVSQPLINQGTINLAGGTLLFNSSGSGIISNRSTGTILGVGNVTQTVINNGTIMAANPVSGLNIFSVGLSDLNTATIGASNGATLNVVISGGSGSSFNNNGSITMLGGSLIISNAIPGVISNNFLISGSGTIAPAVVNNSNIIATVNGGTLDVTLFGGTNKAIGNLFAGLGATLQVQSNLVNLGTIAANGANGGTIQIAQPSGVITNLGTIFGNLTFNSFVRNETTGLINTTNGVLTFNALSGLANAGTINIANGATLQSNSSNSWASAGTIDLRGGTLRTGGFTNTATSAVFTNTGLINGYGTLVGGGAYNQVGSGFDKSIANLGTIIATNPLSGLAQTLVIDTGGATAGGGIQNLGNIIVASNNTLSLSRQTGLPILNTGTITINNGTLTGSGVLSNVTGGIIQGYGTLTHQIVNLTGGTIRSTNGILTMTSTVFPVNQGTLEIANNSTMTWNTSNSWINSGTVSMLGGTLRTGGDTNPVTTAVFTNLNVISGNGTIFGGGAYNQNGKGFDKSIVNLGTITATNGVLTLDTGFATSQRGLANLGTMIVATTNDTLVLSRQAEITGSPDFVTNLNYLYNSGTILINGGTLTSTSSVTNQFESLSLPGLIEGFGRIFLTNELVNLGTIRSTNTVAGGDGIMRFISGASPLRIAQQGTLEVELGSQMIFGTDSNAPIANAGTILMHGGTLRSGVLTNLSPALIAGFGTIASTLTNLGVTMATNGELRLTGTVSGNGAYRAVGGASAATLTFANSGSISALFNTGGTIRVENILTNNSLFVDAGTLVVAGGTYQSTSDITNISGAYIRGNGTITARIFNSGTISELASGDILRLLGSAVINNVGGTILMTNSALLVDGVMTNLGAVTFINSVGTFNGDVYNGGTWTNDPTTNSFNGNLNIGGSRTLITSVDIIRSNLNVLATGNYRLTQTSAVYVGRFTTNAGTITLSQNSFGAFSNNFHNSGSYLSDGSRSEFYGVLNVSSTGRMTFSNQSAVSAFGFVTNAGTVSFINSVGTFSSNVTVTNGGAWIMASSTNIYRGMVTVASNGYISVTSPSVSRFSNSFVNVSTRSNDFDTLDGTFIFDGVGGYTQAFYVAGINLGGFGSSAQASNETSQTNSFAFAPQDPIYGFTNNFALGTLEIGSLASPSTLELYDSFGTFGPNDGLVAGLYVNTFTINAGSLLIISNNVEFYFKSSNGVTGVSFGSLNPGDNVLILGNGSFHQLGVVPEPSILMLFVLGALGIYWRRRQKR